MLEKTPKLYEDFAPNVKQQNEASPPQPRSCSTMSLVIKTFRCKSLKQSLKNFVQFLSKSASNVLTRVFKILDWASIKLMKSFWSVAQHGFQRSKSY